MQCYLFSSLFFFFNDTATTEIYPLSLHDALPISAEVKAVLAQLRGVPRLVASLLYGSGLRLLRSEEHTSELQSRLHLVCRLLLEKKKKTCRETDGIRTRPPLRHVRRPPAAILCQF